MNWVSESLLGVELELSYKPQALMVLYRKVGGG